MARTPETRLAQTAASLKVFHPVPLASLRLDTVLDFDLYHQPPSLHPHPPVLYRDKNLPFTEDVRKRLQDNNVTQLLVDAAQEQAFYRYVQDNLSGILADTSLGTQEKAEVLYLSMHKLMAQLMADPRSGPLIQRSRTLVIAAVDFVVAEKAAFENLLAVVSHDYYTYTHSVNVLVYSIALGQHTGHSDLRVLREFGEGLLLHDIGKSRIDPIILNRKGRLTREQWAIMQRHPIFGEEIVREHGISEPKALDVVRHHHEKLPGTGYPDRLTGNQISVWARICAIADIFDALTTRRPYKDALPSFDALRLMKQEMHDDLDGDLFRSFVTMMGGRTN